MLNTVKRHLLSALVTFVSTIAISVLVALSQLDPKIAWSTYLEAGSFAGFILVIFRAFIKVLFESLIPAVKTVTPILVDLFKSAIAWSKNLISNTKE